MKRVRAVGAAALMVCMTGLTACGSSGTSGSATSASSGSGSASAVSSTAGKIPEHTYVDVMNAVPQTFAPAENIYSPNVNVIPNFMATLVVRKGSKPGSDELPSGDDVAPYLAKSWKKLSNGDYVFTLRSGVKSAAGNLLTTADVVYSFKRMAAVDPTAIAQLDNGNVNTKDPITPMGPHRFRLNVTAPSADTLGALTWFADGIVDEKLLKAHATAKDPYASKWFSTHSASFGAYSVSSFQPGSSLTLKANPYHWTKPYFTTVVIKAVSNASTRLQLMLSGQASHTTSLTWPQFKEAQSQGTADHISADTLATGAIQWLLPFESYKPFKSRLVREALNLGLNRSTLRAAIFLGNGAASGSQIPSTLRTTFAKTQVSQNIARAKALLKQAGYPNGFSFTLAATPSGTGDYISDEVSLIQQQLAQIGVKVTPDIIASPTEFDALKSPEATLEQYNPDPAEAGLFLNTEWSLQNPYSPGTQVGYKNPVVQKLLAKMDGMAAGSRRDALIKQIYQHVTSDQPGIAVIQPPNQNVTDASITGYKQYSYPITFYEYLTRAGA